MHGQMLRKSIEDKKTELMNQIGEKLAIAEERHEKAEIERIQKLKIHVCLINYNKQDISKINS